MQSLRHYLMESVRTYKYVIKVAGDCDSKFSEMFKFNLKTKFDAVSIDGPKTTPIQKDPYGFPDLQNQSVNIFKAEFKYPATEPMIQQVAQQCGCNINNVRAIQAAYDESITDESDKYMNQESPVLLQTEMPDNGKEASKDYANQYLDKVVPKKPTIDMKFDGKATPIQPNKSKEGINTASAMGNGRVPRPELPKTGGKGFSK